jgi:hypothetical protein
MTAALSKASLHRAARQSSGAHLAALRASIYTLRGAHTDRLCHTPRRCEGVDHPIRSAIPASTRLYHRACPIDHTPAYLHNARQLTRHAGDQDPRDCQYHDLRVATRSAKSARAIIFGRSSGTRYAGLKRRERAEELGMPVHQDVHPVFLGHSPTATPLEQSRGVAVGCKCEKHGRLRLISIQTPIDITHRVRTR